MIIFFDIDETLLNQRRAEAAGLARFLQVYAERLPRPPSLSEFCAVWRGLREKHATPYLNGRLSFREYRRRRIQDLFAETEPNLPDDEADARFAVYLQEYRRAWCPFDDVLPCLESLSGCTLGIVSNGNSEQQRLKLARMGIADRFEVVVISEELGVPKPRPEIFLEACRRGGCRPDQCVYVGDKLEADARGSHAAGLRGIWLDRRRAAAKRPFPNLVAQASSLCHSQDGCATELGLETAAKLNSECDAEVIGSLSELRDLVQVNGHACPQTAASRGALAAGLGSPALDP